MAVIGCGGRGTVIDDPCPDCDGTGERLQRDRVTVRIPRRDR